MITFAGKFKIVMVAIDFHSDKNDGRAQEKISFAEKRKQRLQEAEARKKAEEELRLTALEEERKRKEVCGLD